MDVEVLTADSTRELPEAEILYGAPVRRVRAWPRDGDQLVAPEIARYVAQGAWDVVHVQCYQTFVAPTAMAAAGRTRSPYVLTFHGGGHSSRFRNAIRRPQLQVLRPLLQRSSALIASAEWEIDYYSSMLDIPASKFVLIPNGGDLPPAPAEPPRRDGKLLVSVGRLERYKGHQFAITALPDVLRTVPDARLWIAGDGPFEPELRALAERLGVGDRVDIRAVRDRAAYVAELSGASVAMLLSEFETHPIAAIEAIRLGIPMLVANNSGLAELARKGLAHAVSLEAGGTAHAAEIVRLIQRPPPPPQLTMPTWDDCVDQLVSLYRSVATRRALATATV